MTPLKHTFKTDLLFKTLFIKHPALLKNLTAHLLSIPLDSIAEFKIGNPEMPIDRIGKKFSRLDILMIVNGH